MSNSIVIPVLLTAGITILMRVLPALFTCVGRLYEYPRLVKFLDYTVCLILGELICHMAIKDLPQNADYWPLFILSIVTLTLSGLWMYYSQCLLKSFLVGFAFFTSIAYFFGDTHPLSNPGFVEFRDSLFSRTKCTLRGSTAHSPTHHFEIERV